MDANNILKILFDLVAEQEQIKIQYQVVKNTDKVSNS